MPDLATAIPGLMQLFTPETRREAERLVDDDAVMSLDLDEFEAVAEVALDDTTVGARWVKMDEGWRGQTDAAELVKELVLCSVLVAVGGGGGGGGGGGRRRRRTSMRRKRILWSGWSGIFPGR
jgi:hypothetical protein